MILIGLILGYQKLVSPLFGPSCRLYPCCSQYGLQAIRTHGAFKGTALTTARLVRCNPWNKGGIDPIPRPGEWRSPVMLDGTPRGSGQIVGTTGLGTEEAVEGNTRGTPRSTR